MYCESQVSLCPDEVEQRVRQHFDSTKDYVTAKQIRSLFSTFTRKFKGNTLVEPTPSHITAPSETSGASTLDDDDDGYDYDDDSREEELMEVTEDIISQISTWEEGTWVVVRYRRKWLPGQIVPPNDVNSVDIDEDHYLVSCMERKPYSNKLFKCPTKPDPPITHRSDILLEIKALTPASETELLTSGEVVYCELSKSDFEDANEALRKALRED